MAKSARKAIKLRAIIASCGTLPFKSQVQLSRKRLNTSRASVDNTSIPLSHKLHQNANTEFLVIAPPSQAKQCTAGRRSPEDAAAEHSITHDPNKKRID